jgi:hypothetical protein
MSTREYRPAIVDFDFHHRRHVWRKLRCADAGQQDHVTKVAGNPPTGLYQKRMTIGGSIAQHVDRFRV